MKIDQKLSRTTLFTCLLTTFTAAACVELGDPAEEDLSDDDGLSVDVSEISTAPSGRMTARIVGGRLDRRVEAGPYVTLVAAGVADVVLASDRIVRRDVNGAVWGKDGAGGWLLLSGAGGAVEIAASGNVIARRTSTGAVYSKQGALTAPWVLQVGSGAKQIAVAGCPNLPVELCDETHTIGYIAANDVFFARHMTGRWVTEGTGVAQISMGAHQIGALTKTGVFLRKVGVLDTTWETLATGVRAIAVGSEVIAWDLINGGVVAIRVNAAPTRYAIAAGNPELSVGGSVVGIRQPTGAIATVDFNSGTPVARAEGAGSVVVPKRRYSTYIAPLGDSLVDWILAD